MAEENSRRLVVYGATSFVGQIICGYLFARHGNGGATSDLQWAMAGRSRAKLESVRASLGAGADAIPLIVADADDAAALATMCEQASLVLSTVGPYALYGSTLVQVCAESGTDYCDLTGEIQWVRRMLDAHADAAQRSGARIVHCSGFDSVPSDLGVHHLQRAAEARFGAPCSRVRMRVRGASGTFSGGTVASLGNAVKEATSDPSVRAIMANPYAICPPDARTGVRQDKIGFARKESDLGAWSGPFIMAGINTRVVHRSNALRDHAWGADFRYDEAMMMGRGLSGQLKAVALGSALAGYMTATALPPARWLLERFVNPAPGEGPSPEAQEKGFYDFRFFGETADGRHIRTRVTGDRDPGYGSTAKIIGEVAACMLQDEGPRSAAGGFWTPATLMGDALIERLTTHAGLSFEVLDDA